MIVHVDERGKSSQTIIRPLHYYPEHNMTMVEASPLTGRTHQIRVHLFHVKHPIVGDPIYGQEFDDVVKFLDKVITPEERLKKSGSPRLLLHAHSLEFHYNDIRFHIVSQEDFAATCFKSISTK
jgi:23S rRNA pseudouridine1911/1915/1917 synthase